MSGQGEQGVGQPSIIACRVEELEQYCDEFCQSSNDELTLDGLREKIAGIPPDAVRGSDFFHNACYNATVTLEMVECLLDAFPDAARSTNSDVCTPLHCVCVNTNLDPGIVRLLLDRWPESVNHNQNSMGTLPLHSLCACYKEDEADLLAVLDLLLAAAPQSTAELDVYRGALPIHIASQRGKSYPFCERLIDAYPQSLRVQDGAGGLPIHIACRGGNFETVKYMLELYPESIDARADDGDLPIHWAAHSDRQHKADIIQYLLTKDPDCALKAGEGQRLPLHVACYQNCLDSVRLLFDAYPEAIDSRDRINDTPLEVARAREHDAFVEFLEAQLVYVRLAADSRAMHARDENGWLPLHCALRNNASLGVIKQMIAGNPSALRVAVNQLAFPLHIACEFSMVNVVQHVLGLSDIDLHTLDLQKDSTLHYACRGGNLGVVKFLLGRGVPSVSEPNSSGRLPIHLLWESVWVDRGSVEYVDAVRLLLLAHPETVVP